MAKSRCSQPPRTGAAKAGGGLLGLEANDDGRTPGRELTTLTLQIQRGRQLDQLASELRGIPGVINVTASQITE